MKPAERFKTLSKLYRIMAHKAHTPKDRLMFLSKSRGCKRLAQAILHSRTAGVPVAR